MALSTLTVILATISAAQNPAQAQGFNQASTIIYDNFGPGDTYIPTSSWALSATAPVLANPFTPQGGSFRLDRITLALTASPFGLANEIDVWFMSDAGGFPDKIIEAFHFSNAMPPYDLQLHPPLIATSIFHPLLEEGTRYWVAASVAQYATTPGIYASWQWNPTGDTGPFVFRETGHDEWVVNPGVLARGAYRVEGVPVADSSPPTVTITASPMTLWPPNGKLVAVTVSGTINDEPGGSGLDLNSATYAVTDEYEQMNLNGNIGLETDGSYIFTVPLEAWREGKDRDGRHYTITVRAKDVSGNLGFASTVVTVPHDHDQRK